MRIRVGLVALLGIVAVVTAAITRWWYINSTIERPTKAIQKSMDDPRRDCPGHSIVRYIHPNGDSTLLDELTVPKDITKIPEFHDCQRLLIGRATIYGPLVGIFASNTLASMPIGLPVSLMEITPVTLSGRAGTVSSNVPVLGTQPSVQSPTQAAPTATGYKPAAELEDFDDDGYADLGIESGFNCLYLFPDATKDYGMAAYMVPVADDEAACDKVYDSAMNGTPLSAVPHDAPAGLNWEDIPPVARWEWDQVTRTQYIGIRCGRFWCEVGRNDGFGSSPDHHFPINKPRERRTFWIKGWYDEQQLAFGSGGSQKPMAAVGTVVPDSLLDTYEKDIEFPTDQWVRAATIALTPPQQGYKDKLGLEQAYMHKRMNELHLCKGTWEKCSATEQGPPPKPTNCSSDASDTWWARIKPPQGNMTPRYFCVIHTSHPGIELAATARWRWLRNDETIWVRCAEGCCMVNSEGGQ